MFTRIILCLALMGAASSILPGQSLDWVFLEPEESCTAVETDCNSNQQCYGLMYTPSLSGTVTSYTLGFLSNCVEGGTASLRGQSCTMTDNTDIQSACGFNLIQILPSGNSGSLAVTQNVPIKLHEVCVSLPPGRSMTFSEDESLSLTVSIDLPDGGADTDQLTYNTFTASSADCGTTLPVTWESFTVRQEGKDALLNWATSNEIDHDYFIVEWGTDGRTFSPLATVRDADWQLGTAARYSFNHETPTEGRNYYRIRQVDFSDAYSFSTIESLYFQLARSENGFDLFPNPAISEVQLRFTTNDPASEVQVFNVSGQLLFTQPADGQQLILYVDNLPKGVYLIKAGSRTKRLVKR